MKSSNIMTEQSLTKNIFLISVPLMLSSLLQVLFNLADVAVVGRYSSSIALGAVGSTVTLVTLFTGFIIGIGNGINVIVAQKLGAKQSKDVFETVQTSFILSVISGVILLVLCFFLARPMLTLLKTKNELIDGAVTYFKICALGMPALSVFNFGNAVLSANGDTKRPLIYLSSAGILNVLLNLFFVIVCRMAEDGVATASVISEYLSAILIVLYIAKSENDCKLNLKKLTFKKTRAKIILSIGISSGLQNAVFAVANLFIQSAVNSFDHITVEGNSAAANADILVYNVMAAFYTVCSAFMGQNFGAGKRDRVMKSYYISLFYSFLAGAVFGIGILLAGKPFLYLFTKESVVVDAGIQRLTIMCFSYMFSAFMDCTIAASRGLGKSLVPTVIVILGSCVFRIAWIYTVFNHFGTIESLYLLYIFSWLITAAAEMAYFFVIFKKIMPKDRKFTLNV